MKKTVKVTNLGKRMRDRLGLRFFPNKSDEDNSITLQVNSREYLTLKAVKDFKVEVIKVEDQSDGADEPEEQKNNGQDNVIDGIDYEELTITQVIELVQTDQLTPSEALAYELATKNRSTLINQLEEMEQKQEQED